MRTIPAKIRNGTLLKLFWNFFPIFFEKQKQKVFDKKHQSRQSFKEILPFITSSAAPFYC
jgi:hypothetical protein